MEFPKKFLMQLPKHPPKKTQIQNQLQLKLSVKNVISFPKILFFEILFKNLKNILNQQKNQKLP